MCAWSRACWLWVADEGEDGEGGEVLVCEEAKTSDIGVWAYGELRETPFTEVVFLVVDWDGEAVVPGGGWCRGFGREYR